MVQSTPDSFEERLDVRKYFGKDCLVSDPCDIVFVVGRIEEDDNTQSRIVEENLAFGDILQEDFVDSYNNLTLKSLFTLKYFNSTPSRSDRN